MKNNSSKFDNKQIQIQKLYNELKEILNKHQYDLNALKNDIRQNEIDEFCDSIKFNIRQKMKFRHLMRLLNDNNKNGNEEKTNIKQSEYKAYKPPKYNLNYVIEHKVIETEDDTNSVDSEHNAAMAMVVLVVGDKGVGKTRLIQRYITNQFITDETGQTAADALLLRIHREIVSDQSVDMKIIDNADIKESSADAIIICYDKNEPESYEYCLKLRKQIKDYVTSTHDTVIILVACKSDEGYSEPKFEEKQTIDIMDDSEWKIFNFWALECSAKTGVNVENIFITAAQLFVHKKDKIIKKKPVEIDDEQLITKECISLALREDGNIKWTKIDSQHKGIEVEWAYTGKGKRKDSIITVRSTVKINVTPDEFYDFVDAQNDGIFHAKLEYDTLCLECRAVTRYGTDRCLVYSAYKAPNIADYLISARDFCYVQVRKKYQKYKCKKKTNYIAAVIGYSVDDAVDGYIPQQKGRVRAHLYMTGFVVKKIMDYKYKSKAYYILKMDPCGRIPHFVVNYTAKEKGYDIKWVRDHLPNLIEKKQQKIKLIRNNLKHKHDCIVSGYIREICEKQRISIPVSIVREIMIFYTGFDAFSSKIRFIEDKRIKTNFAVSASGCVAKQIVSCDLCDWYEWEFKVNKWSSDGVINFGYIGTPQTDTNWDTFLEYEHNWKFAQFFVTIGDSDRFKLYGTNQTIPAIKNKKRPFILKIKPGDRFKTRVDFTSKNIKLYYNDEKINSVYNKVIPNAVIPAVSLINAEISVVHVDYN